MELKTDKSHKKLDLKGLDLKKAKRLGLDIGLTSLTLLMLSGCGKKSDIEYTDTPEPVRQEYTMEEDPHEDIREDIVQVDQVLDSIDEEDIVEEKKEYSISEHNDDEKVGEDLEGVVLFDKDGRYLSNSDVTYGDLKNVDSVIININTDRSCDVLNYLPNVESIEIYDASLGDSTFDNVDGSRLPSNVEIKITPNASYSTRFTREKYGFLSDIPDIGKLTIQNLGVCNYDSKFIQSLVNVHNLEIGINFYSNFEFDNLSHLDSLTIVGDTYDIPVYLSSDNVNELKSNGVNVNIVDLDGNDISSEIEGINSKIDDIVSSLNIDDNMSDQDKLNVILTYVLTEYNYDEEVSDSLSSGTEISDETRAKFYGKGELTGNFLNDTQICGNYAAMTSALCKRVGLNSYNLISDNHAWNAVKIGDYYYYVDSTWLDGQKFQQVEFVQSEDDPNTFTSQVTSESTAADFFKENNKGEIGGLSWYLEDPTEIDEINTSKKESHDLLFTPVGLDLKDVPEDVENQVKYKEIAEPTDVTTIDTPEDTVTMYDEDGNTFEATTEEKIDNNVQDVSKKKAVVKINGKTIIISVSALVGVLSALGIGKLVHDKKERERRRRREREMRDYEMNSMFSSPSSYGRSNSWGSSSNYGSSDSWDSSSNYGGYHW